MDREVIIQRLGEIFLVPVVVIDDAARAADTARALAAGGIPVMEITLRTQAGLPSLGLVREQCPEILAGAGTVLSLEQCREALARGASFIVSPGYDSAIVGLCLERGVPVFPGCVTPTEITAALKAGIDTVKFFPANVYGGIKAIKALAGPFPMMRFIPTGGVSASNLAEYVQPEVFAAGGGWLCERQMIREGRFGAISMACREAVETVKNCRSPQGTA